MRILILTQYYPPEIGAPQNRLHELAIRLQDRGVTVEVLTALPNYPKMEVFDNYKNGKLRFERIDNILQPVQLFTNIMVVVPSLVSGNLNSCQMSRLAFLKCHFQ